METIDLSQIEALLSRLSDGDRKELENLVAGELGKPFLPNPGPQTAALESEADILLYGGAAGGGKTALIVGAYFDAHHMGVIFRREAVQLDGVIELVREIGEGRGLGHYVGGSESTFKRNDGGRLKLAGMPNADDWRKYAGNARDYIGFDEAGEFLAEQVFSVIGWLRSVRQRQRCRVVLASNPPRGGDGEWLLSEFAPWLDPMSPSPAKPGELRWAIRVGGVTEWVDGPGVYVRDGQEYEALSRTFIPARLDDNPYLANTRYRAVLQGLPEPLRSQLLYGDFLAGRQDHEWQVVPSAWVDAAQQRWREAGDKPRRMLAISADIALGGADNLTIASLHEGNWFSEIAAFRGVDVTDPKEIAAKIMARRRNDADVSVDLTGGWGSGVRSHLIHDQGIDCAGIVYSSASGSRTADQRFGFRNLRAEMWWRFREALDPEGGQGEKIMLPPSSRLKAELTTPRWKLVGTDILVESKEEIAKRIGGSTDYADVIVQLWHRRLPAEHRAVTRRGGAGRIEVVADYDPLEGW